MNVSEARYVEASPKVESSAKETLLLILPSFYYTSIAILNTSLLQNYVTNVYSLSLLEFIVIVLPIILNVTVSVDYLNQILVSLNIILIIYCGYIKLLSKRSEPKRSKRINSKTSLHKNYITNARSTVNLISVIAILAVDFKVFPRKFTKNDTFGFSLMDVGVGLYVFANGIISPEVRGHRDSIKKTVQESLILLLLGIGRFVTTYLVNYNVSALEYGQHWNFFITLSATKIFTSFFLNVINMKYLIFNAIALVVSHEVLLQCGLKNYIIYKTERTNILDANREGLVSVSGFVSIYLLSVYIGKFVFNHVPKALNTRLKHMKFFCATLLFLIGTFIFERNFGISRRLANASYCFWILFNGTLMTWLYYIFEDVILPKIKISSSSPYIFNAINYNGLAFFLIGNVLTGLINLSINTMQVSDTVALCVITGYMLVNCGVIMVLYLKQIKLKL